MTLRTITFDDSIYKLVPLEPTEEMITAKPKPAGIEGQCVQTQKRNADIRKYQAMVAAAPEYQEPEQLCDDGGKCGAGGYCITCPKLKG